MLIKYPALSGHLKRRLHAVYVLVGLEYYFLNEAALQIKKIWRQQDESDDKVLHINTSSDWSMFLDEANSYSLFANQVLLDVRYDKKTIESSGKETLTRYLKQINPRCLIILRFPNVPTKQMSWLVNHEQVTAIQAYPLSAAALQDWIMTQLRNHSIQFQPQIPSLIHQFTQGNMLACSQVIEKLILISNKEEVLSTEQVMGQLIDQCDYQLYELADACLSANLEKAIHLLRQACNQKTEPTLILWLLMQEIRQLIQLSNLCKQSTSFTTACNQLKIWPQRTSLYQKTLTRIPLAKLYQLLHFSQQLDEQIKSNQNNQIWHQFEQIVMALCLGNSLSFNAITAI